MEEPGEFVVATLSYCHVPCVLLEDKPPLLPTICSVVAMQAPSSLWGWPSPAPSVSGASVGSDPPASCSVPRDVLTSPSCWQYAVLLNRFNYPFDLEEDLHLKGYRTILQRSLPHCPESLKCYLSSTPGRMPSERHQVGNLKKYYLLNAASLLPVLALEPRDGEKVLDLCAAPGGKLIALLQCAYPGYLHCNEYDGLRLRWLRQTLESFIPQPLVNVIKVSELDGREVGDAQPETFDKVLVDAPCSNDRSWLFSSESQKAACRISQRRNLPVLQIELLRFALN